MRFRTLVGIILIAISTSLSSREPIAGQSAQTTVGRIAYESCYFDNWDTYRLRVQCRRLGGWRRNRCRASRLRAKVVSRRGTHRLRRRRTGKRTSRS